MTPQPPHSPLDRIEPIIWLLSLLVLVFALLVIGISKWSPNDGQVFQVISGMATTILGILANRIMPGSGKKLQDPPPGSLTHTQTDQVVRMPPTPPADMA